MSTVSKQEQRAEEFIQQGEKALKRFSLFSSASKFEDACDYFQKAANSYKVAKKWQEAGDAFARCADCSLKLNSAHEAATYYVDAANSYAKVNPGDAITFFNNAIAVHTESGRFAQAAKLQKQIAELHEQDNNATEAIAAYKTAADYFEGENSTQAANACKLKVADMLPMQEPPEYDEAIAIFEKIGESCLESNLLKFNAKGHFLKAGLLVLCKGDDVSMRQKLEKYMELDFTFGDSRECKFATDLTQAFEDFNLDDFTDHVYNYDNVSKLDAWKTSILLRIKDAIKQAGEETPDLT